MRSHLISSFRQSLDGTILISQPKGLWNRIVAHEGRRLSNRLWLLRSVLEKPLDARTAGRQDGQKTFFSSSNWALRGQRHLEPLKSFRAPSTMHRHYFEYYAVESVLHLHPKKWDETATTHRSSTLRDSFPRMTTFIASADKEWQKGKKVILILCQVIM